jgi:Ca-activated chloride channel homolog
MRTKNDQKENRSVFMKAILLFAFAIVLNLSICGKTITGIVTDSTDKMPIVGVSVVLKGSSIGTVTDVNGAFSMSIPDSGAVLLFYFIGYEQKEIKLKNETTLSILLHSSNSKLEEVIAVGYGTQNLSGTSAVVNRTQYNTNLKIRGVHSLQMPATSPPYYNPSDESYSSIRENGFKSVGADALSTFSIDVDRASYANVRRFVEHGQLPPTDAVRVEELINYFEYNYPQPIDEHPFSINTEYTDCPWQKKHKLLRIGLQGKQIPTEKLPASNLVFLIDVSGSMLSDNKLPLVKSAFRLLTNNLRSIDRVAIVVYAGAAGVVLPSTSGNEKQKILDALNSLNAGGSTAGGEGIELAYQIAKNNFIDEGNNRVILATDGDFNVGVSAENELEDLIETKRKDGIFLTCLGFGMGNYKDSKMEIMANKGNGNYSYINNMLEANKVFVNEFGGTLFTIAKDVKIQIEFNPKAVQSYRLIGYENRLLNNEDFKDDTKDAGELGCGHTVTALYEIIPTGVESLFAPEVDELKYQKKEPVNESSANEMATVKFRYKKPNGIKSIEMIHPISSNEVAFGVASENTRFAASVAMFGMILTNSEYKGESTYDLIATVANQSKGNDIEGYRGEFVRLIKTAENLEPRVKK